MSKIYSEYIEVKTIIHVIDLATFLKYNIETEGKYVNYAEAVQLAMDKLSNLIRHKTGEACMTIKEAYKLLDTYNKV